MIGCLGRTEVDPLAPVKCLDGELEDARWFTRDEVRRALLVAGENPYDLPRSSTQSHNLSLEALRSLPLKVPPAYAIAHQLMKHWCQQATPSL